MPPLEAEHTLVVPVASQTFSDFPSQTHMYEQLLAELQSQRLAISSNNNTIPEITGKTCESQLFSVGAHYNSNNNKQLGITEQKWCTTLAWNDRLQSSITHIAQMAWKYVGLGLPHLSDDSSSWVLPTTPVFTTKISPMASLASSMVDKETIHQPFPDCHYHIYFDGSADSKQLNRASWAFAVIIERNGVFTFGGALGGFVAVLTQHPLFIGASALDSICAEFSDIAWGLLWFLKMATKRTLRLRPRVSFH